MAMHLKTQPGIQNSIPQPTVYNPLKAQRRKKICENMQIIDGNNLCLLKKGKQKVYDLDFPLGTETFKI